VHGRDRHVNPPRFDLVADPVGHIGGWTPWQRVHSAGVSS
jgi:hypothetical protein